MVFRPELGPARTKKSSKLTINANLARPEALSRRAGPNMGLKESSKALKVKGAAMRPTSPPKLRRKQLCPPVELRNIKPMVSQYPTTRQPLTATHPSPHVRSPKARAKSSYSRTHSLAPRVISSRPDPRPPKPKLLLLNSLLHQKPQPPKHKKQKPKDHTPSNSLDLAIYNFFGNKKIS